jgi:hypothetical protein
MCLICGVSVNLAFSNLYRQAANLSHYMNRDKELDKECARPLLARYHAASRSVGELDMIGVEGVKNLKILFPAAADVGGNDGEIQDLLPCVYIAIRVLERSQMLLSNH